MTTAGSVAEFKAFLDRLNEGDLDSVRRLIAADYFAYAPGNDEPTAADVFEDIMRDLKAALPDLSFDAHDLRLEEGLIKGRVTVAGTFAGPLWAAEGSGNRVAWTVNVAVKPVGKQFAVAFEDLQVPEVLGVLRQLNLVNPPDQMDLPPKYPVTIPESLLQVVFNGQAAPKPCSHMSMIKVTDPTTDVCEQCVAAGDIWPALRMCLICGFVGCCDTSKNKHMKQHYETTGHGLFRSIRLSESWCYCYDDSAFIPGRKLARFKAELVGADGG